MYIDRSAATTRPLYGRAIDGGQKAVSPGYRDSCFKQCLGAGLPAVLSRCLVSLSEPQFLTPETCLRLFTCLCCTLGTCCCTSSMCLHSQATVIPTIIVIIRMGVNVWLKDQLKGTEHSKSLPLLSSTTGSSRQFSPHHARLDFQQCCCCNILMPRSCATRKQRCMMRMCVDLYVSLQQACQ